VKRVGPELLVAKRLEAKNLPPVGDRLCGGASRLSPLTSALSEAEAEVDDSARDALFTQPAAAIITASRSAIVSLRPTFPHGIFEQALTPSIAVAIVTSVTQSGREVNGASPADSAVRSQDESAPDQYRVRRALILLVGPTVASLEVRDFAIDFLCRLAVSLLQFPDQLVPLAGDYIDIVIGQVSPRFTNLALELHPVSFDRLLVHDLAPVVMGGSATPSRDMTFDRNPSSRCAQRVPPGIDALSECDCSATSRSGFEKRDVQHVAASGILFFA